MRKDAILQTSTKTLMARNIQRLIKSAQSGDPIAQYELAACYHSGRRGVEKDSEKALYYLKGRQITDLNPQKMLRRILI